MRRIAPVGVIFGGFLLLLAAAPAQAEEIEVREVALRRVDEGLSLDVDFGFELTPRLADIVANGVPLYFSVEFELTRRRWYWFDETAASQRLSLRLSYHALSRQYRLSTGLLQQSFPTLEEALNDSAYRSTDTYVGPAGITWLHRWALTRGMRGAVFAGEPEVPDWIAR